MSEKTLRSIVTAFAVLLIMWGASLGMGMTRPGGGASFRSGVEALLNGLDPSDLTGLVIRAPGGETTTLTRSDDSWKANGHPADPDAILRIWGILSEVEVGGVAAANPINHARMGVLSDSAWTVVFQTDSGDRTLLIGHAGRVFGSSYVRLPEEDEVVLTTGDLRSSLARSETAWRDKTIALVDTTRIARIIVERHDGERTTILRGEVEWTVDGVATRPRTIADFMTEVAQIVASGFKTNADETLEDNERLLRVEDSQGTVLAQLRFLGNGTTQHAILVPSEGSGTVSADAPGTIPVSITFEIPSWRVERLTPTRALLEELDSGG